MKYFKFWVEVSKGQTKDVYCEAVDEVTAIRMIESDYGDEDVLDCEEISQQRYEEEVNK